MVDVKTQVSKVKEVRDKSGCGIMLAKEALSETEWDVDDAVDLVKTRMMVNIKLLGHSAVFTYNHNHRIASIVVLSCNTDFVGRTDEFMKLGEIIAQQIVGANPQSVEELLSQESIRDSKTTIKEMVEDLSRKTQENINVVRFNRENA